MLYMGYPYGGPLEHLGEYHLHSTHSVYGTVVWDGMYTTKYTTYTEYAHLRYLGRWPFGAYHH